MRWAGGMLGARVARRLGSTLLAALAVALLAVGAPAPIPSFGDPASATDVDVFATPTSSTLVTDGPIDHVIAISIDGLRADAITRLGAAGAPNLTRILQEGAGTLEARNLTERTVTMPNHASMFTGRRVTVAAGGMGVKVDVDPGGTIHTRAGEYVSSVFDVVHDAGGTTALYATKDKFAFFERSWPDAITDYAFANPSGATDALIAELVSSTPYDFAFLHLKEPDSAGHRDRWMSRQYLAGVRDADAMVGRLLAAIDASPELTAHTAVIVTSDHGGHGLSHDTTHDPANYRIPFMVWGPDVAAGADLYALNPGTRLDPGTSRPGYSGLQPVRNGEVANLATDLLDLPPVPGSLFDARHDLNVFPLEPAD